MLLPNPMSGTSNNMNRALSLLVFPMHYLFYQVFTYLHTCLFNYLYSYFIYFIFNFNFLIYYNLFIYQFYQFYLYFFCFLQFLIFNFPIPHLGGAIVGIVIFIFPFFTNHFETVLSWAKDSGNRPSIFLLYFPSIIYLQKQTQTWTRLQKIGKLANITRSKYQKKS